jgi:hypothetical protein
MGKMLVALIGLGAIAAGAYYALRPKVAEGVADREAAAEQASQPSAPKRQLDNVRQAADRIEAQGQDRADKAGMEPAPE